MRISSSLDVSNAGISRLAELNICVLTLNSTLSLRDLRNSDVIWTMNVLVLTKLLIWRVLELFDAHWYYSHLFTMSLNVHFWPLCVIACNWFHSGYSWMLSMKLFKYSLLWCLWYNHKFSKHKAVSNCT